MLRDSKAEKQLFAFPTDTSKDNLPSRYFTLIFENELPLH